MILVEASSRRVLRMERFEEEEEVLTSFRRCPVGRGLQQNDPRGSFGPSGTQHGASEEEDGGEEEASAMVAA